jgi:hypothetical protein
MVGIPNPATERQSEGGRNIAMHQTEWDFFAAGIAKTKRQFDVMKCVSQAQLVKVRNISSI